MEQYKNVLVIGATGYSNNVTSFGSGKEIVKAFLLSSRPWKVSVLARESAKQDPKKKELLDYYVSNGATVVIGDVEKPETLTDVFKGIDLVISVLSGSGMYSLNQPEKNAIRAAHASGVKRFVPSFWSYDVMNMSADDSRTWKLYLNKVESLNLIKSLGMEYTFFDTIWFEFLLAPALGFDFEKKTWELPGDGTIKYSAISLEDIGTLVEEIFAHPELSKNVQIQLVTDEFSANEMVDIFEQESGLKITKKYTPIEEIRQNQIKAANEPDFWNNAKWNIRRVYAEDKSKVYFPQPFNKVHKELQNIKTKGYRQWIREFVAKHQV